MRTLTSVVIVCVLSGSLAIGQSSASHTVVVNIPAALRLSVAGGAYTQTQTVPLLVEVAASSYRITPGNTRLTIFANTYWQLFISYAGDPLALTWQLGDRSGRLRSYPQVLASGEATRGRRTLTVYYGLVQLPADGRYRGLVIYTLTRP